MLLEANCVVLVIYVSFLERHLLPVALIEGWVFCQKNGTQSQKFTTNFSILYVLGPQPVAHRTLALRVLWGFVHRVLLKVEWQTVVSLLGTKEVSVSDWRNIFPKLCCKH
jgi:hypothetical protein